MYSKVTLLSLIIGVCYAANFYDRNYYSYPNYNNVRVQKIYRKPEIIVEKPRPYQMEYEIVDELGNKKWRQETGDEHNTKQGSYGYQDINGLSRQVKYIADDDGFRVYVVSNEPGVENSDPADAKFTVSGPPKQKLTSKKKEPVTPKSIEIVPRMDYYPKSAYVYKPTLVEPLDYGYIYPHHIQIREKEMEMQKDEMKKMVAERKVENSGRSHAFVHQKRHGNNPFEYNYEW